MEKKTLVLDASVIVKWFCDEEYTDIALRIRDKFFEGDLNVVVPELMFYEVLNAVRYNEVFSKKDKRDIIDDLFSVDFDVVIPDREILSEAMKLALKTDTPVYDNVYLAVSRSAKCSFITADERYVDKIKANDVVFLGDWG
ncbi:MAG: hypothetical protein DRO89_02890 [Candidatus Altiarchaeales archaeon]|nr:MAG: hypothetical protein DRO89_02890 [Candidatus Altiarchaeales archaeon]